MARLCQWEVPDYPRLPDEFGVKTGPLVPDVQLLEELQTDVPRSGLGVGDPVALDASLRVLEVIVDMLFGVFLGSLRVLTHLLMMQCYHYYYR